MEKKVSEKKKKVTRKKVTQFVPKTFNHERLIAEETIKVYELTKTEGRRRVEKELLSSDIKDINFELREVSKEQLYEIRSKKIPSFIFKDGDKLFWTEIPKTMNFMTKEFLGKFKCAPSGGVCDRLSAASDEQGGCAKVRDIKKCIESYDFIILGYEIFGTNFDVFHVAKCTHFKEAKPQKVTYKQRQIGLLSLAQCLYPDIETLSEVNEKMKKNMGNMSEGSYLY